MPSLARRLATLIAVAASATFLPAASGAATAPATDDAARGAMRIEGRLLAPNGQPLASGTVRLFDAVSGGADAPLATVAVDRDGSFAIAAPNPGLWVVRAGAPGREAREALVEPVDDVVSLPPVTLPRPVGISLQIVDEGGEHPPAALVGVYTEPEPGARWHPVPAVVGAGDDGRATLPAEAAGGRALRLIVQAAGHPAIEHEIRVDALSTEEPQLVLVRGIERRIQVLDATGRPAAAIELYAACGDRLRLPPLAVTDDGGRATLTAPRDRSLPLTLVASGGHRSTVRLEPPASAETSAPATLRLPAPVVVRGRVIQAGTGRPLAGALVWERPAEGVPRGPLPALRTDSGGAFELAVAAPAGGTRAPDGDRRAAGSRASMPPDVAPSPVLAAVGPGHHAVEIDLDPGARAHEVVLPLPPLRLAVGTVVDVEARPVAGARVSLSGPAVLSDHAGRFGVPNPPAGRHDLEVRAPGFAPLRVPGVELASGRGEHSLGELVLLPGSGFEGHVVDPDGEPVAGAQLLAIDAGVGPPEVELVMASSPEITRSDDTGRFRFDDLEAGEHWLLARRRGYLDSEVTAVEVPAVGTVEVVLRPAASISGWVLDPEGQGVADALVTAERDEPDGLSDGGSGAAPVPGRHATTGEDGRFEIPGASPGRLTLIARAGGFLDSRLDGLELGPGEELPDLEIRLRLGASLAGTVWGPAGAPAADVLVGIEPADGSSGPSAFTRSDGDGRFRLGGLEPGAWRLTAESPGGLRARAAARIAGGETLVDLHLEEGATVAGRVRDRDGRPLASARIVLLGSDARSNGRQTVTDAAGAFTFAGVSDGAYQLTASSDGHLPTAATVEVAGAPVSGLDLELSPGVTLRGRLLGVPPDELARAIVTVPRVPGASSRLDYAGRFSLSGLPAGELLVELRLPGRPPLTRRLSLPEGMPEVAVQIALGADGEVP